MIVTRAPYRVSFFGGGTDYPEWFEKNGGCFLSLTINHFCYITLRVKPPFQEKRYRVSWRIAEDVNNIESIKHPIVRNALQKLDIKSGLDITYTGDLPGGSGLGSSSAFTVALLQSLYASISKYPNSYELAKAAYDIERKKLKEIIGVQDQIATAFGGFNHVLIKKDGSYDIKDVLLSEDDIENLFDRLVLLYTGVSRLASSVAEKKVADIMKKTEIIKEMQTLPLEALSLLQKGKLDDFGKLLHENWLLKRSISAVVSNAEIDNLYSLAMDNGALGGKLLGAGSGGCILFFCKEGSKKKVENIFNKKMIIPIKLSSEGSKVVYNEEVNYGLL